MGKQNTAMRSFLRDKERFADLFNGVYFQGRPVIQPNSLREASEVYSSLETPPLDRTRDLKMIAENGETFRVLALENQSNVDYTLPFRCMQYDALEYNRQLRDLKKYNKTHKLLQTPAERLCGIRRQDRVTPVYTLCLYHGEEPWDGPLSLKDMVAFGEAGDGMEKFFADYPITLFCVNMQKDFRMFHTDLKQVFTAMNYRKDKRRLYECIARSPAFRLLDAETLKMMSVVLDAPNLWKKRELFLRQGKSQNEEEYDMCQAMRELLADARAAGRKEGIRRGITQGITQGAEDKTKTIVSNMLTRGMSDGDICAIAECDAAFVEAVRKTL